MDIFLKWNEISLEYNDDDEGEKINASVNDRISYGSTYEWFSLNLALFYETT